MLIVLLTCILILVYFVNFYFNPDVYEKYINQKRIIFLTKKNATKYLLENGDGYYDRFYKKDLEVRHVKSVDEYKKLILKSTCSFTRNEMDKLKHAIYNIHVKINAKIQNLKYSKSPLIYQDVNLIKLNNLTWKLGLICSHGYENGLPHTRGDIIFIHRNDIENYSLKKLEKTLVHEFIHIYQKKYQNEVDIYLTLHNFKKVKKRSSEDNIRANPDLDDYIYQDNDHNTYKAVYNVNANSVEDVTYYPEDNQKWEHPNEKMAIEFEKILVD